MPAAPDPCSCPAARCAPQRILADPCRGTPGPGRPWGYDGGRTTHRPAGRLVPALERLARRPHAAAAAFTLIEILVAITLSTVLLLMSTVAFRAISHAIAAGNDLSTQNAMLLCGWRAALDDADYYHSMADDKPPYNKGFMRNRTSRTQDGSTPDNQGYMRRPFQPILFNTATDPDASLPFDSTVPTVTASPYYTADAKVMNPEVLQAHDYRSIDRSHLWFNFTCNHDGYRFVSPVFVHGDYRLVACTDMRTWPGEISPTFPTGYGSGGTASVPIDLDMVNTDTVGPPANGGPNVPIPTAEYVETIPNLSIRSSVNMTEPLLYWQMFNRMTLLGATEYTSMGYNIFIQDQDGYPPGHNQGNFPGALVGSSPLSFPSDGNNAPQTELAASMWDGGGGIWWREDALPCKDFANFFGIDFFPEVSMGCWGMGMKDLLATGPDNISAPSSDGTVPPPTGYDGGGIDGESLMTRLIDYRSAGIGSISGNIVTGAINQEYNYNAAVDNDQGDVARNDRNYRTRTVRLPYNITDGEFADVDVSTERDDMWGATSPGYIPRPLDYETKPPSYPTMETSMIRYYRAGGQGQLVVTTTSIQLPDGQRLDLPCTPYTTSVRGARQHWRLYSATYSDPNAIGDFYDTSAGPFYRAPASVPAAAAATSP